MAFSFRSDFDEFTSDLGLMIRGPDVGSKVDLTAGLPSTASGHGQWLFYVDDGVSAVDGDASLVASVETENDIYIARFTSADLSTPTSGWNSLNAESEAKTWTFTRDDGTSDFYAGIADHWHIFAHGYHWIACSLFGAPYADGTGDSTMGVGVMLIRFTVDAAGAPQDIEYFQIFSPESTWWSRTTYYYMKFGFSPSFGWNYTLKYPTNDLFLVEEAEGVAVGIYHRSSDLDRADMSEPADDDGHLLIHVPTGVTSSFMAAFENPLAAAYAAFGALVLTYTELYGSAYANHQNLASATKHRAGIKGGGVAEYRILAPTVYASHYANELLLIKLDGDAVGQDPVPSGAALHRGAVGGHGRVAGPFNRCRAKAPARRWCRGVLNRHPRRRRPGVLRPLQVRRLVRVRRIPAR